MGGFIKGLVVGVASFALGFVALSVLFPPEEPAPAVSRAAEEAAAVVAPAPLAEPEAGTQPAPEETDETQTQPLLADDEAASPEATAQDAAADQGEGRERDTGTAGAPAAESAPEPVADPGAGSHAEGAAEPAPEPATAMPPAPATAGSPGSTAPAHAPLPDAETPAAPEPAADPALTARAEDPAAARAPVENMATAPSPEPGSAAPGVIRAVPPPAGLGRAVEGVTVGRLPAVGEAAAPEPETPAPAAEAADRAPPAWQRYAAPFAADPALPLFAVILLDPAPDPAAEAALRTLPFAVAVALDPADPDAPRRAALYRAAGHEIVLLAAGLPPRATASDIEVTLSAWFATLPETVALIDPPEGGFQGDRQLAQRLMPALLALERGLITLDRGLNPARQSARSAGVVQTTAFRVIDGQSETEDTIRRYLDRAVFRAQQEGRVAVIGRADRPETIAALLGWRLEGRAGQVALAPVSALLRLE